MHWHLFYFPLSVGLLSSFSHCAGMCGPLHMAIRSSTQNKSMVWMYHAGRLTTYGLLGSITGLVGSTVHLSGLPVLAKSFSFAFIVLYISLALVYLFGKSALFEVKAFQYTSGLIHRRATSTKGIFQLGLLGGLLPCPTTLAVLAWALAAPHLAIGVLGMLVLGVATLPSFLLLSGVLRGAHRLKSVTVNTLMGILFFSLAVYQTSLIFLPVNTACH